MEMLRWLATNKVVQTVWGLGILSMLMSSVFGGSSHEKPEAAVKTETAVVEQVAEVKAAPEATTEASIPVVQALVATEVVTEETAEGVSETIEVAAVEVVEATESAEAATTEVAETVVETETTEAATEVAAEAVEDATEATETEEVTAEAEPAEEAVEAAAVTEEVVVAEANDATEVDADSLADMSSADLLVMAREAYWNNGLDESAEIYKVLIEREPTVIEHKGELGNVFWRQGYPKQAAELYAEIAAPMIEKGNVERVSNMVGFIGLFFPEKAAEIRTLLDAQ